MNDQQCVELMKTVDLSKECGVNYKPYQQLRAMIETLNDSYYNKDISLVTDFTFDSMLALLVAYERHNSIIDETSPTNKVGGNISSELFTTHKHPKPMLSLENVYDLELLPKYFSSVRDILSSTKSKWTIELKIDGLSLGLEYKSGYLHRALLRGDGIQGDDVTAHMLHVEGVPLRVDPKIKYVRGEVIIPNTKFLELNAERVSEGKPEYANCRNLASGSMRLKNTDEIKHRGLNFIAFDCEVDDISNSSEYAFKVLADNGFTTSLITSLNDDTDDLMKELKRLNEAVVSGSYRNTLDFDIDGLVIKLDDYQKRNTVGSNNKFPKWAKAYKFPQVAQKTELVGIRWQVGRTGRVTPIAEFFSVQLNGTTVSQATLHNISEIARLDIHINDTIYVEKGGEIIPKIIRAERTVNSKKVQIPTVCPSCGAPLELADPFLLCTQDVDKCPTKLIKWSEHLCKALDIDWLSEKSLTYLYEAGLIKSPIFILDVEESQLATVLGKGMARNVYQSMLKRKDDFVSCFKGLGMFINSTSLGTTFAKLIAKELAGKELKTHEDMKIPYHELIAIKGIGSEQAATYIKCLEEPMFINIIDRMLTEGMFKLSNKVSGNGKKVCVTGKTKHNRKRLQEMIEEAGFTFSKSVTKDLDILVLGENAGTKKAIADKLIVEGSKLTIVTEDAMLVIISDLNK
jgi:DNA ligase (NAD+)